MFEDNDCASVEESGMESLSEDVSAYSFPYSYWKSSGKGDCWNLP